MGSDKLSVDSKTWVVVEPQMHRAGIPDKETTLEIEQVVFPIHKPGNVPDGGLLLI